MILLNKLLAEIFDYYALYQLHKERSKASHYRNMNLPVLIEELNSFYAKPKVPNIQFKHSMEQKNYLVGNYKFTSEIQDNGICNEFSIGTYYKYKNDNHAPNVILVHGWRMKSTDRINKIYLKCFLDLGYNVYHFTLPYHFDRNVNDSLYNGELMISTDIERTLLSVKQAVTDLRALIYWLKEHSNGKVIVIGVSLGGFITNLLSVVEEKIDSLISVMYANSMAYSVWNTIPGKFIKKDFMDKDFTYEQLKKCWAIIDPSLFKPKISKERILLFSGLYDKYVVKEDTDLLWEAWERPTRIVYHCGHAGIVFYRNNIAKDTIAFLNKAVL